MGNIDDIRNDLMEYDLINPLITYPGEVLLINRDFSEYKKDIDTFYLNSIIDKNKGNLYEKFLDKYYYKPLEAETMGKGNYNKFYPLLETFDNKDGIGRSLKFNMGPTIMKFFEDKDVYNSIRESNPHATQLEALECNINYFEDQLKGIDDFRRKGSESKYCKSNLRRILKLSEVYKMNQKVKDISEFTPDMIDSMRDSDHIELFNCFKSNLRVILRVLYSIKKQILLDENRPEEYKKQMQEDFMNCFNFDKFVLCVLKQIIEHEKRAIAEDNMDNALNEVTNFFNILDEHKGVKFNPSIKVYDSKAKKIIHYNVNDLRLEYNRIKKKHPELCAGNKISSEQIEKMGLARNQEKFKKFQEFLTKEEEKVIYTDWDIIGHGEKITDSHEYGKPETRGKGKKKLIDQAELEKRHFAFFNTNYALQLMGKEKFTGYVGYIYNNGLVVFEKDDDIRGANATYVMNIKNFIKFCKLTKPEIIEYIKNTNNKDICRLYHNETWEERLNALINATEITDETLMAVEALSTHLTRK